MSAIIDALASSCRAHGVELRTSAPVDRVLHGPDGVRGVVTVCGEEFTAPRVISAVNPVHLFRDLLDDTAMGATVRDEITATPMRGSAFKVVLEVDSLPGYAGLPDGTDPDRVRACQFRVGAPLDGIEESVTAALAGRVAGRPLVWGLVPTLTSPGLTPGAPTSSASTPGTPRTPRTTAPGTPPAPRSSAAPASTRSPRSCRASPTGSWPTAS